MISFGEFCLLNTSVLLYNREMRTASAVSLVFVGGFIIMVLEIIGARFLAKDFGSSFYVWVSQIGVVLVALALGYYLGGALADRLQRLFWLGLLLIPTALLLFFIPRWASTIIDHIISRHPIGQPIPQVWQKLDPVLGSALIFLLPCVVLATLSPFMIRLSAQDLNRLGRASGLIIAASTVGSIGGVFIAGFILIEKMGLSTIFKLMGWLTALLGVLCMVMDRLWRGASSSRPSESHESHN
jgi:MFS family permease